MFKFFNRKGRPAALLNPAEKGVKYSAELKTGKSLTNLGECKLDKNGNCKKLTRLQRAFRSGYLRARSDSAKAYNYNRGIRTTRKRSKKNKYDVVSM